jgi:nucleoside-diphosphate-sugar epimerase
MKKVLALGGAGFIGSYVVRELLRSDFDVTVVDDFSKYGFLEHDFYAHPRFRLRREDVRRLTPEDYRGYDVVLCLAALIGGIQYFHRIPYRIARDNTDLLTRAIDCTREASPEALFVYFSSSMVYERMQRPVTEEDALAQPVPLTNYGMQKLFGEFVTRGAHQELGLQYLIVRPFNAVGAGELPIANDFGMAHVIPDFVYKAMVRQTPFQILGDGEQVRTFTHAQDIADAICLMLRKGVRNDDFNLCGEATVKMGELARRIWARVNPDLPFPAFQHMAVPPADVRYRVGVSDKARRVLDWKPRFGLDSIIDDSWKFIRERLPR